MISLQDRVNELSEAIDLLAIERQKLLDDAAASACPYKVGDFLCIDYTDTAKLVWLVESVRCPSTHVGDYALYGWRVNRRRMSRPKDGSLVCRITEFPSHPLKVLSPELVEHIRRTSQEKLNAYR